MRKAILPFFALASVFVWVACDSGQPTGPDDLEASLEIFDGANPLGGQTSPHFFWLPPMVKNPTTMGTFTGLLNPVVVICTWPPNEGYPDEPCSRNSFGVTDKWIFTTNPPPDAEFEGVTVDENGQHYQLNWHTDDFSNSTISDYRISVWLGDLNLGWADVKLLDNGSGFKNLDEEVIGLIDGRTLPIKFRLEIDLCATQPGDCAEIWDIAYHTLRDVFGENRYDFNIYLLDKESGVDTRITPGLNQEAAPSWSPDGSEIAYQCFRNGLRICVMNADGTDERVVTEDFSQHPAWSPTGEWIAFQGKSFDDSNNLYKRDLDIFIVRPDGTDLRRLTFPDLDGTRYEEWEPTWHPFGDRVTFGMSHDENVGCPTTARACDFDIVSVYWENGEEVNHTKFPELDQNSPAWSPDGKFLLYSAEDPDVLSSDRKYLWAVKMEGDLPIGEPIQLTSGAAGEDQEADISPDGRRILFTRAQSVEGSDFPSLNLYIADWNATNPGPLSYTLLTEGGWGRWR